MAHRKSGIIVFNSGVSHAPAPGNVGADEGSPPEPAEDAQQDKGREFEEVPGGVELDIEEDQAAVAKGIDGAQGEGGHQSSEEGAPERLQGEVVADLGS